MKTCTFFSDEPFCFPSRSEPHIGAQTFLFPQFFLIANTHENSAATCTASVFFSKESFKAPALQIRPFLPESSLASNACSCEIIFDTVHLEPFTVINLNPHHEARSVYPCHVDISNASETFLHCFSILRDTIQLRQKTACFYRPYRQS